MDHQEQRAYDAQDRISLLDQWFHIKGTEHEEIFKLPSLEQRTQGKTVTVIFTEMTSNKIELIL